MANPTTVSGGTSPQSVYDTSTDQEHELGTLGRLDDRKFRYASYTAATALQEGTLMALAANVANHVNIAYASGGALNTSTITVTLGATAATANQYADGWLLHNDGTNPGQLRRIKSHPAAASAATLELTLYDRFSSAITDGELSLKVNKWSALVTTPGDAIVAIAGCTQAPLADSSTTTSYFWVQTAGPCGMIGDGSVFPDGASATPATAGVGDAGQITVVDLAATAALQLPILGEIMEANLATSDADGRLVDLRLE